MYTAMPFKCEPGTEFSYALSNDWLALAVEGASGMDFEASVSLLPHLARWD